MSDLSGPCWLCGAHHEPGNPTDLRCGSWECRRCQRATATPMTDTERARLPERYRRPASVPPEGDATEVKHG